MSKVSEKTLKKRRVAQYREAFKNIDDDKMAIVERTIDFAVCQVVNDVKTKNIVYMKMQSIIILCIFIIIHLLFSILSCSF